ncbi:MAG: 4Fe-4S dicluster domain-containing protein [Anaerohalosphaera sp.]|nr:4Fe-4S dicluster domain-containing protein [Anaerohalosphaera sp.]
MKVLVLTEQKLMEFLASARTAYDVRVPVSLHDGTRVIGRLGEGPLAIKGGAINQKITSIFFPHMETVLKCSNGGFESPEPAPKPMLVVGFTKQDADCLEFIDRFYNDKFRDDVYFNKRDNAVIVCVSGRCGANGKLLKVSGDNCDMELICDGQDYIVRAYTDVGKSLIEDIGSTEIVPEETLEQIEKESDQLCVEGLDLLNAASKLLLEDKVPDEFWQSISDRCIACTSCNLACPTCTCFDVFDRTNGCGIDRWRIWDSCQLDGFMREASGHNPMGQELIRTRRRIHHKLAADVTRWGHITCYQCGRCDNVCPTGIGIMSVCKEMVEKYG